MNYMNNVQAGGDFFNTVNYVGPSSGSNNGARARAVTVSIDASPIGPDIWVVTVSNGGSEPITDLEVKLYLVDETGVRTSGSCDPAKGKISIRDFTRLHLGQILSGGLDAIGDKAASMYPGTPPGISARPNRADLVSLGTHGQLVADSLLSSPQGGMVVAQIQAAMLDRFPSVLPAGEERQVLYVADGGAKLRADIVFSDADGRFWERPFGESPRPL